MNDLIMKIEYEAMDKSILKKICKEYEFSVFDGIKTYEITNNNLISRLNKIYDFFPFSPTTEKYKINFNTYIEVYYGTTNGSYHGFFSLDIIHNFKTITFYRFSRSGNDWGLKTNIFKNRLLAIILLNLDKIELFYRNKGRTLNLKQTFMQKLTFSLKRILNKNLQVQYKAGFRNGNLELTEEAKDSLLEMIAVEREEALTNRAKEILKEEEEEAKKGN